MRESAIVAVCGLLFSCNSQADLQRELVGQWRNVSIKVDVDSIDNGDSSSVFAADESNWAEKLGIQPIRTYFRDDGTYYSEYYNLNDSLVYRPSGVWSVRGDSLSITQQSPDNSSYSCKAVIANGTAEFTCMLDWDQDGREDDLYVGIQKRYRAAGNSQ